MVDVKCEGCGRKLCEAETMIATIHCPKSNCKHVNHVKIVSQKTLTTYIVPLDNAGNQA